MVNLHVHLPQLKQKLQLQGISPHLTVEILKWKKTLCIDILNFLQNALIICKIDSSICYETIWEYCSQYIILTYFLKICCSTILYTAGDNNLNCAFLSHWIPKVQQLCIPTLIFFVYHLILFEYYPNYRLDKKNTFDFALFWHLLFSVFLQKRKGKISSNRGISASGKIEHTENAPGV